MIQMFQSHTVLQRLNLKCSTESQTLALRSIVLDRKSLFYNIIKHEVHK